MRISCFSCSFTGPAHPCARLRVVAHLAVKITRESLERASTRTLARRYRKTRKTIVKMIHTVTRRLPTSSWVQQRFLPRWSGVLVFDGKVIRVFDHLAPKRSSSSLSEDELRWRHKMSLLCGVDYGTGDLPHYALASAESKIDLVMYFQALKAMQYPLKAVVCDGNPNIPEAARFVFGEGIIIQLCTRHFIEGLKRLLPAEGLSDAIRERLERTIRGIQSVIESDTIEEANEHLKNLDAFSSTFHHPIKTQCNKLFQRHKNELCAHVLRPELCLPHTSNDAENLFRQLNLRLRSLGRFFHHRYAGDYLNAWALLRRFTPFTDCKGERKHRNGKSPLELAGCTIKKIDPMKLRQEPF